MTIAVQTNTQVQQDRPLGAGVRVVTDGKFLRAGDERFLLKGVTYGTFAPDADGYQFPNLRQVSEDFRLMADLGINTVRTYTLRARTCWTKRRDTGYASWSAFLGRSMSPSSTIAR